MQDQVTGIKISDLIDKLLINYDKLDKGEIEVGIAKEKTNIMGKVAKFYAIKLTYNMYMGIKAPIDFLEQPKTQIALKKIDEV